MVHTLEIFEELKSAALSDAQARAITHAVQRGIEIHPFQQDLKITEDGLRSDLVATEQRLKKEMLAMKLELIQDVTQLEMRLIKYIFAQAVVVIGSVVTLLHFLK